MAVTFEIIDQLFAGGLLPGSGYRVLDIGCTNIHTVTSSDIIRFVRERTSDVDMEALRRWAELFEVGATVDPEIGGLNGAWLGDLLVKAGMRYASIDIVPALSTHIVDLNNDELPSHLAGRHDAVLNFGTASHIVDQDNVLRIIHDATALGGIMYHDMPVTSFADAYCSWDPKFIADLAAANDYEIVQLRFGGGVGSPNIGQMLGSKYRSFGVSQTSFNGAAWVELPLVNISVQAILRKLHDHPFRRPLNRSALLGPPGADIERRYARPAGAAHEAEALRAMALPLLRRLKTGSLTVEQILAVHARYTASPNREPFPLSLEIFSLEQSRYQNPGDATVAARLESTRSLQKKYYPLLNYGAKQTITGLEFDGVEESFDVSGADHAVFDRVVSAYRAYEEHLAIELFPARLECIALTTHFGGRPWPLEILYRLKGREGLLQRGVEMLHRLHDQDLTREEISEYHAAYSAARIEAPFPLSLEVAALRRRIADAPSDKSATERLAQVMQEREKRFPALVACKTADTMGISLKFDGREDQFVCEGSETQRRAKLLGAYRLYDEKSAVELFPERLLKMLEGSQENRTKFDALPVDQAVTAVLKGLQPGDTTLKDIEDLRARAVSTKTAFPITLDILLLEAQIGRDAAVEMRLSDLYAQQRRMFPLLKYFSSADQPENALRFDGVEADFEIPRDENVAVREIRAAYARYHEESALELFPPRLEAIGLHFIHQNYSRDPDIMARLGIILREVTPSLTIWPDRT